MRKIIVAEFLTLDGVMEASAEWQLSDVSDDAAEEIKVAIHAAEASLYGRTTYEMFAAYWPSQTNNEFGIADKLNSERKFIVSNSFENAEWNNSTLIRGKFVEKIRMLSDFPISNRRRTKWEQ